MHFCNKCGNMYYVKLQKDSENQLVYYCKKCGNQEDLISEDNLIVSKTELKHKKQTFHHIINKYTKMDPTLPHIDTIPCPNTGCITNKEVEGEEKDVKSDVIYMRYDDKNMRYVYICTHCDTIWQSNTD